MKYHISSFKCDGIYRISMAVDASFIGGRWVHFRNILEAGKEICRQILYFSGASLIYCKVVFNIRQH